MPNVKSVSLQDVNRAKVDNGQEQVKKKKLLGVPNFALRKPFRTSLALLYIRRHVVWHKL